MGSQLLCGSAKIKILILGHSSFHLYIMLFFNDQDPKTNGNGHMNPKGPMDPIDMPNMSN